MLPDQARLGDQVELVAAEVEQVVVDDREPGLPGGLHDQPGADVVAVDDDRVAAGQPGHRPVAPVAYRGDHVVRAVAERRALVDREQRLEHVRVGVLGARPSSGPAR